MMRSILQDEVRFGEGSCMRESELTVTIASCQGCCGRLVIGFGKRMPALTCHHLCQASAYLLASRSSGSKVYRQDPLFGSLFVPKASRYSRHSIRRALAFRVALK